MIWIDLNNKYPTQVIPNWDPSSPQQQWTPWPQERWDAWLNKSKTLVNELAALDAAGKREERNALIDANREHWGELKEWLLALSAGKCWFSEVRELYSHYDVEHFRPKKESKSLGSAVRDGYWWLAFDYMNFRVCGNVGNRKKGGWFPLKEGSLCSTFANQCEESEAYYLIDPINDDDVDLISFDEEGKVIPTSAASEWDKQRVQETITRLKLNDHVPLAEERRKVWQKVDLLIEEFTATKARCTGNNPAAKAKISEVRKKIRELTDRNAELSAVAKWCILLRNDPLLYKLVS